MRGKCMTTLREHNWNMMLRPDSRNLLRERSKFLGNAFQPGLHSLLWASWLTLQVYSCRWQWDKSPPCQLHGCFGSFEATSWMDARLWYPEDYFLFDLLCQSLIPSNGSPNNAFPSARTTKNTWDQSNSNALIFKWGNLQRRSLEIFSTVRELPCPWRRNLASCLSHSSVSSSAEIIYPQPLPTFPPAKWIELGNKWKTKEGLPVLQPMKDKIIHIL